MSDDQKQGMPPGSNNDQTKVNNYYPRPFLYKSISISVLSPVEECQFGKSMSKI